MARIAIDVDLTICEEKKEGQTYLEVKPLAGAVETIRRWKNDGHYIIISTARGMGSYQGDINKCIVHRGKDLMDWLEYHNIPFDELNFKVLADVYIDDRSIRAENWKQIKKDVDNLIKKT
jgi:capsule biosynthesis phosphatase